MSRKIIIKTNKEAEVSVEELYELRKFAFQCYADGGLYTAVQHIAIEQFQLQLKGKAVIVAQDAATSELLGMHTFRLNKQKDNDRPMPLLERKSPKSKQHRQPM